MTRHLAVALLMLFSLATPAAAKPFYKRWTWWTGWGAQEGFIGLDLASTARVQYVCAGCQEENIFSPHETHLVRIGLIDTGIETGLNLLLSHLAHKWHLGPRWETGSDFMWPVASGAQHIPAAIHNYNLASVVYQNHVNLDVPLPGGQTPWRVK